MTFFRSFLAIFIMVQSWLCTYSCTQLSLRHTDPGGVGYGVGYTSGTALIFPDTDTSRWAWPLVDLRAHAFNNQTEAANAGAGARFAPASTETVFGLHTFYDYRNTSRHFHYHQVGLGFEMIGKRFDLRLNCYLPVGIKSHTLFHCNFDAFVDNFPPVKRVEVALRGFNLEVGAILKRIHSTLFYAAIGPYYFGGNVCHHPIGGKFRTTISFRKYLFIEGSISYDQVFKTRGQGVIGFTFPIDCKQIRNQNTKRTRFERLTQPVQRFEIIVLDKNCWWQK